MENQNIVFTFFSLLALGGSGDCLPLAENSIKKELIMRNEPNFQKAKNELNPLYNKGLCK
jgi:hypothetical protein